MEIQENQSLRAYNTFGVAATARYLAEIRTPADLDDLLQTQSDLIPGSLVLGSGSNVLFVDDYAGLVIHNRLAGIEIVEENTTTALVAVYSGTIWHQLVEYALDHNLGGLENLSLIPGTAGAAPIQNIGAYGAELSQVLERLEAVELASGRRHTFTREDCRLGYRDSIFKHELQDRYFITRLYLRLHKPPHPINTTYGNLARVLEEWNIGRPTIRDISRAVIHIRQSKLPDPARLGNAGSFFKNPVIDVVDFERLKLEFPAIPGYKTPGGIKVPAAWLIEQCGWKGKRLGAVGVHDRQPLVLVHYGGGSGRDIRELAGRIGTSVADRFGIKLEPEPRIVGAT